MEVLKTSTKKSLELVGLDLFSESMIDKYSEDIGRWFITRNTISTRIFRKKKNPLSLFLGLERNMEVWYGNCKNYFIMIIGFF